MPARCRLLLLAERKCGNAIFQAPFSSISPSPPKRTRAARHDVPQHIAAPADCHYHFILTKSDLADASYFHSALGRSPAVFTTRTPDATRTRGRAAASSHRHASAIALARRASPPNDGVGQVCAPSLESACSMPTRAISPFDGLLFYRDSCADDSATAHDFCHVVNLISAHFTPARGQDMRAYI